MHLCEWEDRKPKILRLLTWSRQTDVKKNIRSEVVKITMFLVALKIKSNNMETTTPRKYPRSDGGE